MKLLRYGFAALAILALAGTASIASAQTPSVPQPTVHMAQNHVLNFEIAKLPADMTIARGDSISITAKFSRDIGLFDPAYMPKVVTVDRRSGDVLKIDLQIKRLDADTIEIGHITTSRDGWAEIQFVPVFGAGQTRSVNVHVK